MNEIIHGDSLEIIKNYPDNYFDLLLTDPPYGIGADKGIGKFNKNKDFSSFDWDKEIPCKEFFYHMQRIAKFHIIWGGNYFIEFLKNSRCWIFWSKPNLENRDFSDGELAYTNLDKNTKYFRIPSSDKNRIHPTQKPVRLFEKCIDFALGDKNDIKIIDPFSGSGTTAIACHNIGISFICIEREKFFYEKSVERYENHIRQNCLF